MNGSLNLPNIRHHIHVTTQDNKRSGVTEVCVWNCLIIQQALVWATLSPASAQLGLIHLPHVVVQSGWGLHRVEELGRFKKWMKTIIWCDHTGTTEPYSGNEVMEYFTLSIVTGQINRAVENKDAGITDWSLSGALPVYNNYWLQNINLSFENTEVADGSAHGSVQPTISVWNKNWKQKRTLCVIYIKQLYTDCLQIMGLTSQWKFNTATEHFSCGLFQKTKLFHFIQMNLNWRLLKALSTYLCWVGLAGTKALKRANKML